MQHARWLIIALSAIQIAGLVAVVVLGSDSVGDVNLFEGNGASGVLSGAAIIFFAYIGFDEVITLSEETHNPTYTIPRALFLALGISTLIYIAVAIVAVSVLGVEGLTNAEQPLTAVMEIAIGGVSVGGSGVVVREFSTDPFFIADSNNIIPTQRAIKEYLARRVSGGGSDAFTGQFTAGIVRVGPRSITTTTGERIDIPVAVRFNRPVSGVMLAHSLFMAGPGDGMQET
jgi:hypothetical protein